MKHIDLITLQGAIEKSLNGLTIQIQSLTTGKWYEPTTISELACAVQEPRPIRVKPEPVFKEGAYFKSDITGDIYWLNKSNVDQIPTLWVRVSDWVKVEIKDET